MRPSAPSSSTAQDGPGHIRGRLTGGNKKPAVPEASHSRHRRPDRCRTEDYSKSAIMASILLVMLSTTS